MDLRWRRRWVMTEVASLRPLVTAVVTDPRNSWWWAPLDRGAQLALTEPRDGIDGDRTSRARAARGRWMPNAAPPVGWRPPPNLL